jgi:hypothetical protein
MSSRAVVVVALACIAWNGPRVLGQGPDVKPIDDRESYAVYSALLPDSAMRGMGRRMIVIQAETATGHRGCWPSGGAVETEWRTALEQLRAENAHARTVLPGFALSVPYVVLPTADIQAIFNPLLDGWTHFYNRYPDSAGYLQLSAVGFDADRVKAIVYMGHSYNFFGGQFSYHLLRRVDGLWQETRVPGVDLCLLES